MATTLKKDVLRETTVTFDDKTLFVTLTADQNINIKVKDSHDDGYSIPILELFKTLSSESLDSTSKPKKELKGDHMINLNDLRSANLISDIPYETQVLFERLILKAANS